uniref:Uncharacterized protein n=1 Tax=Opuntia streptacantha TaxID=393608 RepID=A0A7C8Z3R7_OPUST
MAWHSEQVLEEKPKLGVCWRIVDPKLRFLSQSRCSADLSKPCLPHTNWGLSANHRSDNEQTVEHQDTLEGDENQRKRGHPGRVFRRPPQSPLSTDPFDPHKLVHKFHLGGCSGEYSNLSAPS